MFSLTKDFGQPADTKKTTTKNNVLYTHVKQLLLFVDTYDERRILPADNIGSPKGR